MKVMCESFAFISTQKAGICHSLIKNKLSYISRNELELHFWFIWQFFRCFTHFIDEGFEHALLSRNPYVKPYSFSLLGKKSLRKIPSVLT